MEILVTSVSGETLELCMAPLDSIAAVKATVAWRIEFPVDQLSLSFEGQPLSDNLTLQHYNIQAGSMLLLVRLPTFVITLSDERGDLLIPSTSAETVSSIKSRIQMILSYPAEQQCLVYADHPQMEDDHPLSYYGIDSDCQIGVVLRLRGGSATEVKVRLPWQTTITLECNFGRDTVKDLKDMIFDKEGFLQARQKLHLRDELLEDDNVRLADLPHVQHGTLFQLGPINRLRDLSEGFPTQNHTKPASYECSIM
eukprot:CAMPEP_0115067774 /NCGR_PEP_ID=MMETSP0227-20121206/11592_1 /TAXON_ID=89957 /ORGANISM="Polarella glacialis, Strain CCMP 1383" /LENGTH=253 /DNA_ID=CAMNT_0002453909 /DNA_START=92 /DNA_END=853 /DNA_ORIENTATION=+